MNTVEQILVLTTGGTFDKEYFDALSRYQIGASVVPKVLANAKISYPYRVEEILRKDSLDLTDDDRARIFDCVNSSILSRIVIVHGTDTVTRTAEMLVPIARKTIVLTGALTPARFVGSDAAFNLGLAFATAQMAKPGVYIAMNGSVFPGDEVIKDRQQGGFVSKPSNIL